MAKELYDGIYSSHRLIFIEKVQSNIETFLKGRISKTYKIGQEVLCLVDQREIGPVFKELIENPEFEVNILNNITRFQNRYGFFLLISVSSSTNNFSLLIKVRLSESGSEIEYGDIVNTLRSYFESAGNYLPRKRKRSEIEKYSDLVIYGQPLEGLDCYDLFIQNDADIIEDVFIADDISKSLRIDFFSGISVLNLISKVGNFDWKAAIFPELCFCMSLEELLQIKIPRRVQYIRMLLAELFRIKNHVSYLINITRLLEYDFAFRLLSLESEKVLRLIELITGSRIFPNYIRVGGIKRDLSSEMQRSLKAMLPGLYRNISKAQVHLLDNSVLLKRLRDKGIMDIGPALQNGVTGPNLRASGIRYDLRKNRNLLSYKDISFLIPTGKHGDSLDRVVIRFQEVFQSLKIIKQILEDLPDEYHKTIGKSPNFDFEYSSMISNIECPHGTFKIFMEVEENDVLSLVVMGPSRNSVFNAKNLLIGESLEDINIILSSLDISPGEVLHW